MTEVVLPTERAAPLGRWIVRLVAVVVLIAGVIKVVDVNAAEHPDLQYNPAVLIALGAAEIALAASASLHCSSRPSCSPSRCSS